VTVKVSVISTVRDARPHIEEFLASLRGQTRQPDEVIVVDGGSTDGTLDVLRAEPLIVALSQPGANIARGRNVAIRAAAHEVIAVTDADCVLAPDWLERLLRPLVAGADVAAGFYEPIASAPWQVWATASVPEAHEVRPGWMASSRSLAFRREAYEVAGGYPEWLEIGEDMYLNHRFVATGARTALATDAVVYWRARPTLGATWRQYVRYAEGDALAGMYPARHIVRFVAYAAAAGAAASRNRWALAVVAVTGGAHAARPIRRARRRSAAGSNERLAALAGVPAMMAFIDSAKMWGYLRGLTRRAASR
jgi:glycosyltransferase involved in cell wall biosynthesis